LLPIGAHLLMRVQSTELKATDTVFTLEHGCEISLRRKIMDLLVLL